MMSTHTRYFLVPVSDSALELFRLNGHLQTGLELHESAATLIGRSVRPGDGVTVPSGWIAFSSHHCKLQVVRAPEDQQAPDGAAAAPGVYVVDTSTNGTYVNGQRLARGKRELLRPGDALRLSSPTSLVPGAPPVAHMLE